MLTKIQDLKTKGKLKEIKKPVRSAVGFLRYLEAKGEINTTGIIRDIKIA